MKFILNSYDNFLKFCFHPNNTHHYLQTSESPKKINNMPIAQSMIGVIFYVFEQPCFIQLFLIFAEKTNPALVFGVRIIYLLVSLTDFIFDRSNGTIDIANPLPGHTAGPDHPPIAEVHRPGAFEHTRDTQSTVILLTLVVAGLRDICGEERK